jgi:hypothetical protein
MKSSHLEPNALMRKQMSITAQKHRTVWYAFATKSSFQREMALKMSWAPEKLIDKQIV